MQAQAAAQKSASRWGWATKALELFGKGADVGVDLLGSLTGPAGKQISVGYKILKGAAGGLGQGYADGGGYAGKILEGTGKGVADAVIDGALKKAGGAMSAGKGNIPGLKDYNPGVDWGKAKVGSLGKMLTGKGYDGAVTDMVRDRVTTAAKGAGQSAGQGFILEAAGIKPAT